MDIEFRTARLKNLAESSKDLSTRYGPRQAKAIITKLGILKAASSLLDVSKLPQLDLHPYKGDMRGYYSVDTDRGQQFRIIFYATGDFDKEKLATIKSIMITDIHHDPH